MRKKLRHKWDRYNKWYNNGKPRIRCTGDKVFLEWEGSYIKDYGGIN